MYLVADTVSDIVRVGALVTAGAVLLGSITWHWATRRRGDARFRRVRLEIIATLLAMSLIPAKVILWDVMPERLFLAVFLPIAIGAMVLFFVASRGSSTRQR